MTHQNPLEELQEIRCLKKQVKLLEQIKEQAVILYGSRYINSLVAPVSGLLVMRTMERLGDALIAYEDHMKSQVP